MADTLSAVRGNLGRLRTTRHAVLACSAAIVGLAGCAGSGELPSCVARADATVCATRTDGGLTYTAEGLEPGSSLTLSGPAIGTTDIPVGAGGGFDGEVGLLSATGSFAGEITIEATAADGSTMTGTLTFE